MRPTLVRASQVVAVLGAALVLAGCDADTRDEIAGAIDDAVSEAQSVIEEVTGAPTGDATTAPTPEATSPPTAVPTTDPTPAETTAEPVPPPEETASATEVPAPAETTAEPSPSPSPTGDAAADDGGISWPLVIGLGVALVLLLGAFVAVWRRRRALLARRARLRDAALTDLDWLLGAAREQVASVDAASRARDVRLRQDRLGENLQQLRVDASDELLTVTTAAMTTSRQLTDALIARLDDAVAGRGDHGAGLGVRDLEQQLRGDRDDLARVLRARPDQR